jgi:hypothetical protein
MLFNLFIWLGVGLIKTPRASVSLSISISLFKTRTPRYA